jgi:threonine/homoserine/homoserine lactone efflux protein
MNYTDAIIKGLLLGLFMAISVGPTLFAILRYSLHNSYKAGIAFVLGVSVSDIMYVTLANTAARWLEALKPYEKPIAIGGSALLVLMGLSALLAKAKVPDTEGNKINISKKLYVQIWANGFFINTLNPGVIITWLAAVTACMNSTAGYRFTLFTTCLTLILSIDFLKVLLADLIRRSITPKRVLLLQRISAICLMGIGIYMGIISLTL